MVEFLSYSPRSSVTPAKAGVQLATCSYLAGGIPTFAGMTAFGVFENTSKHEVSLS
jgi:hypothetical protein